MMLQRKKPVRIFGKAEPGKEVRICIRDAQERLISEGGAVALPDGNFLVELPALSAGTGYTLCVTSGTETLLINDAAIGEVWLAGGQSNMEYLMNSDAELLVEKEGLSEIPPEQLSEIRFYDVPEISFDGAEDVWDFSNFGKWRTLTPEDLVYFSAVSYYFERKLTEQLDCPVGVIGCNWGGTKACCWIPEETICAAGAGVYIDEYEEGLSKIPDIDASIEVYKKMNGNIVADPAHPTPFDRVVYPGFSRKAQEDMMKAMAEQPGAELMMQILPVHPWRPAGLYYTMLKMVMPYTIRGFIWYQGCSDEAHPDLYARLMQALIGKWREDFRDPELPFLQVQLAPFGWWLGNAGDNYPKVRAAQLEAADITSNSYVASIGDAGMRYDIHPKHKRKPGERLGLLALRHVYGMDIPADAPRAQEMSYDGDTAVIRFLNSEGLHLTAPENGGLTPAEAEKTGFTDSEQVAALSPEENLLSLLEVLPEGEVSAEIREDTLRIDLTVDGKAVRPASVAFANTAYYEVNLKNKAGIPAYPFTL